MHTPTSICVKRKHPRYVDCSGTLLRLPKGSSVSLGSSPRRLLWPRGLILWTLILAALLGLMLTSRPGQASDVIPMIGGAICSTENPADCVYPIAEGEVAPFAGQLITMERAARLVVASESCGAYMRTELERARGLYELRLAYCAAEKQSQAEANVAQLAALQRRLEAVEGPSLPWWQRPEFVSSAALTAGVTLALTVALVAR